ncbi:NAD-dependent epimerase/dehydratase family protein [Arcticibacter tournemirensis]
MILVTGATGFLGSELVRQLYAQGKRVRALKRESSVIPDTLKSIPQIEWFDSDLLDYFSLEKAFAGISHVYHCAARISFQPSDKKKMIRVNEEGTAHIVDLCMEHGIEKLVHVSSVAALGDSKNGEAVNEKSFWEFDGSQHGYSISKYESEMEVWRGIAEGLNAVIVNPSIIIGKNAGTQGSGQIFDMARKGSKFYTDGVCGMVDVEDVARAMILLMEADVRSERFILNSENIAFKTIFETVAHALGTKKPNIRARPWLLSIAWRLTRLAAFVTGRKYGLTKDTAHSASKQMSYSSEKFLRFFPDFSFKPVKQSIKEWTIDNGQLTGDN